eukprot:2328215-Amphidinium_carterae.1
METSVAVYRSCRGKHACQPAMVPESEVSALIKGPSVTKQTRQETMQSSIPLLCPDAAKHLEAQYGHESSRAACVLTCQRRSSESMSRHLPMTEVRSGSRKRSRKVAA